MAKIFLKNPYFGRNVKNGNKPYYMPVNKFIWDCCGKYSLDLSSEVFDIYLTEDQVELFKRRAINFYIVTYLPFKIVYEICNNLDSLDYYVISPKHDKDLDDNGNLKKMHYHLILRFNTNVPFSKVLYNFHTTEMRSLGNNWFNEFHYLYHGTEACKRDGKYLYDKSELVSNDLSYCELRAKAVAVVVNVKSILFDMENGMSTRQLVEKYDFLFLHNIKNLYFCYDRIKAEERKIEPLQIDKVYDLGDILITKFKNGKTEVISKSDILDGVENESK